ncbi:hypothetical protein COW36_18605 [bacterium (Candidatus Blackallbacteria) CG17_big_fil_post_rev_8_21_14_2_50_48_46]|uniref:Glycosyltransferase 2-like domain-containing protein n=1 Tax=bacterium (Candidatus Blackallbacteria) CG17_big_fil_post_rev_8_21_14_2_50_48_46 TaxID=2014261 RepID=A0A2M7G199_9BACT|nr:MAG: hypothetical protein COW64_00130 [bacterium (Candidatus Blackallbacteria) CG18_big_fil_WC_8_21_14_2_50_49_26]PIW15426.1 MAG: hypothetical protein COW36_18605 [bacterium (Candidatus Blackallbacteria) CG17_big_fil_post_rev_8_21_14_2_50_48_46]PIW49713.1 MAG: hypothetical protein COW20_04760 [bacterium (Candidatus Blackallbacteria) CG13_big_fil_rev_8_21_14_2_50_49_14]
MRLSIIICTSPGRAENLGYCLEMLTRQSLPAHEIWVEEDGQSDSQACAERFSSRLPLCYHSRPRDFCVARSRNQGARRARGDFLIFLDGDILLQPQGLEAYAAHFQAHPQLPFFGYVGHQTPWIAPSYFFPEKKVFAQDLRFIYHQNSFQVLPKWEETPQLFAWSGNCALPRSLFEAVGGFDTGFQGPGWEDVDLGNRLVKAGFRLGFSLDAWAEHLLHAPGPPAPLQKARNRARVGELAQAQAPLLEAPSALSGLENVLKTHYLPKGITNKP